MAAAEGVGLAANQSESACECSSTTGPDEETGQQNAWRGDQPGAGDIRVPETMPDPDDDWEGCLSVPGEQFPTGRADWAKVTGVDLDGSPVSVGGTRVLRPLPAARDRPPERHDLHRPAGRRHARAARKGAQQHGWASRPHWDPAPSEPPEL